MDDLTSALAASGGVNEVEYFVIDNDLRSISIPTSMKIAGVENDDDVNSIPFRMPRYVKGTDLSEFQLRINYTNALGEGDLYMVTDKVIEEDTISFSWLLDRHAFASKGEITFAVCARLIVDNNLVDKEYNTTTHKLTVLEGLETDKAIPIDVQDHFLDWLQEEADTQVTRIQSVGAQIQEEANTQVAQIQSVGAQIQEDIEDVIDSIPSDYSELQAVAETAAASIADLKSALNYRVPTSLRTRTDVGNDRIMYANNNYAGNASYHINKYIVFPGEKVFISAKANVISGTTYGTYIFQSRKQTPGSNTYNIGNAVTGDVCELVTVPDGAYFLCVCIANSDTESGVYDVDTKNINGNETTFMDVYRVGKNKLFINDGEVSGTYSDIVMHDNSIHLNAQQTGNATTLDTPSVIEFFGVVGKKYTLTLLGSTIAYSSSSNNGFYLYGKKAGQSDTIIANVPIASSNNSTTFVLKDEYDSYYFHFLLQKNINESTVLTVQVEEGNVFTSYETPTKKYVSNAGVYMAQKENFERIIRYSNSEILTFFKADSDMTLSVAASDKNGKYFETIVESLEVHPEWTVRDPSIVRFKDKYVCLFTTNTKGSARTASIYFGVATSENLYEWNFINNVEIVNDGEVWAPEGFVNDDGYLYALFSVRTVVDDNVTFTPYYTRTNDLVNWDAVTQIDIDVSGNTIYDFSMLYHDGIYYLAYKDGTTGHSGTFIAQATSINGTFATLTTNFNSAISDTEDEYGTAGYFEGGCLTQKDGGGYRVFIDNFRRATGFYYIDSDDMLIWYGRTLIASDNPIRHGTVLKPKNGFYA